MRLLVDENLSIRVARRLAEIGYDVVHVTGATRPSVVLLRSPDHLTPDEQAELLNGRVWLTTEGSGCSVMGATRSCSGPRHGTCPILVPSDPEHTCFLDIRSHFDAEARR